MGRLPTICRAEILILPSNILTESSSAAAAPSKEVHMYLSVRYMYLLPDLRCAFSHVREVELDSHTHQINFAALRASNKKKGKFCTSGTCTADTELSLTD